MGKLPQPFEAYGFTIEVHAGGRRVWPPSFKRFVKEQLDAGALSVDDVMTKCNVSQSLVYKWRADVKASQIEPFSKESTPYSPRFSSRRKNQELAATPKTATGSTW